MIDRGKPRIDLLYLRAFGAIDFPGALSRARAPAPQRGTLTIEDLRLTIKIPRAIVTPLVASFQSSIENRQSHVKKAQPRQPLPLHNPLVNELFVQLLD